MLFTIEQTFYHIEPFICSRHNSLSNTRCCFVQDGNGCNNYSCSLCMIERKDAIEEYPSLAKSGLLTCTHHFKLLWAAVERGGDEPAICYDADEYEKKYPLLKLYPFGCNSDYEDDHSAGIDKEQSDDDYVGDLKPPAAGSSINPLDTTREDPVYMSILNSPVISPAMTMIYKYSKMPKFEFWPDGTPYRPGKTEKTLVQRAIGFMIWKHMNVSNTTKVTEATFDKDQPERIASFDRHVVALENVHANMFLKINSRYKKNVCISYKELYSYSVALNCKWRKGQWTKDRPQFRTGLYAGHVKILQHIGYNFPNR